MLSHWTIKFLNIFFVSSLGMVTLWLLLRSLASERVRRSSPEKRAELFLRLRKGGTPFLSMRLEKSHYLIGRGSGCDILLKGIGMPMVAAEFYLHNGSCIFRSLAESHVRINGISIGRGKRTVFPGDEITFYNYEIMLVEGSK